MARILSNPRRRVSMNLRRLLKPRSRLGRLLLRGDNNRRNALHCTDTDLAVAKAEESQRVLKVLIAKAQQSIEESRALISKLHAILRVKRAARGEALE
jgi:hypothetical protein